MAQQKQHPPVLTCAQLDPSKFCNNITVTLKGEVFLSQYSKGVLRLQPAEAPSWVDLGKHSTLYLILLIRSRVVWSA